MRIVKKTLQMLRRLLITKCMNIEQYIRQAQYKKGFISPLLLALIAILLIGGGAYVYTQNKQVNQPPTATSTTQASDSQIADWKTYDNVAKGYSVSYPTDAKIDTSDLSCVRIDTKEFGSVYVDAGSQDPCGVPTGIGDGMIRSQDTITIADKQYPASSWHESDNSFSFFTLNSAVVDKISVTYGVDHSDKTDPRSWKNLGPFTDAEYQSALNSAKKVVATLRADQVLVYYPHVLGCTEGILWYTSSQ